MATKLTKPWTSTALAAFFAFFFGVACVDEVKLTIANNCKYTIWPAILTSSGFSLPSQGFVLPTHGFRTLNPPQGWSGKIWARTDCAKGFGPDGEWGCKTGDCRTGLVQCTAVATPPETYVEFDSLGALSGPNDTYRVSVSLGFNVPVSVVPSTAGCGVASCTADVNAVCPAPLRVLGGADGRTVIACMGPCQGLGDDLSCCAGRFRGPDRCVPNNVTDFFKVQCERAVSFQFDTNYVSCTAGTNYLVTFCP